MRTLYHYTSIERWELIKASGLLNLTESNLSLQRPHAGPDVVWLTTDPDCQHAHGLYGTLDGTDKTQVRITVELNNRDVYKWHEWADRHRIDPATKTALIAAARDDGGDRSSGSGTWRVTEKPIPSNRWRDALDRRTETTLLWST
jgi:hypothetical protein